MVKSIIFAIGNQTIFKLKFIYDEKYFFSAFYSLSNNEYPITGKTGAFIPQWCPG